MLTTRSHAAESRHFCSAARACCNIRFTESRESPRPINTQQNSRPIRRSAQARVGAMGNGKIFALRAPRPDYPYEARSRHLTGSGIAIISVHPIAGFATDVTMEQSIGHPILGDSTVSAAGVSNRVHHLESGSRLHFSCPGRSIKMPH